MRYGIDPNMTAMSQDGMMTGRPIGGETNWSPVAPRIKAGRRAPFSDRITLQNSNEQMSMEQEAQQEGEEQGQPAENPFRALKRRRRQALDNAGVSRMSANFA